MYEFDREGLHIAFEIVITILVFIQSYKIYKLKKDNNLK